MTIDRKGGKFGNCTDVKQENIERNVYEEVYTEIIDYSMTVSTEVMVGRPIEVGVRCDSDNIDCDNDEKQISTKFLGKIVVILTKNAFVMFQACLRICFQRCVINKFQTSFLCFRRA